MRLLRPALSVALLAAAMLPASGSAQSRSAAGEAWTLETGLGAFKVPGEGSGNITVDGTVPVVGLRLGRTLGTRWSLSFTGGYGEAAEARRDVYERPSGATRTDTYDYGVLFLGAGAEHSWSLRRSAIVVGTDLGWLKERWRVASHIDPTGLEPPRSSFDGNVAAAARLGLRHAFARQIAVTGSLRYFVGPQISALAPELALRWSF